jgi:tetratricopeptide (TPR) repeat protein
MKAKSQLKRIMTCFGFLVGISMPSFVLDQTNLTDLIHAPVLSNPLDVFSVSNPQANVGSSDPLNNLPSFPEPTTCRKPRGTDINSIASALECEQLERTQQQLRRQQEQQERAQASRQIQLLQTREMEKKRNEASELLQRLYESSARYNENNFDGAEAAFIEIVSKYSNEPKRHYARLYYRLGNQFYYIQKKPEAAIITYRQAIRLNPEYAVPHNAIGVIRAKQGRWEEAIAEYQKAIDIPREYAEVLYNLGLALWQQGKQGEAIAFLEKARKAFKEEGRSDYVTQVEQLLQTINR